MSNNTDSLTYLVLISFALHMCHVNKFTMKPNRSDKTVENSMCKL